MATHRCPSARHDAPADIANRVGNDQLKAIHDQQDRLDQGDQPTGRSRQEAIAQRAAALEATDGPAGPRRRPAGRRRGPAPRSRPSRQHRSLLADPDPVPGLVEKLDPGVAGGDQSRPTPPAGNSSTKGDSHPGCFDDLGEPRRTSSGPRSRADIPPRRSSRRSPWVHRGGPQDAPGNEAEGMEEPLRCHPDPVLPGAGGGGEAAGAEGPARQAAGRDDQERGRPEVVANLGGRTDSRGLKDGPVIL